MRRIAAALAAGALTAAVVGGLAFAWPQHIERPARPAGDPARFLSGVVRLLAANRYARAWQSLAPGDQALAPRAAYVACERETPIPGHLDSLRVLSVRHDRIGVAVRFALRIAGAPVPRGVRVVLTTHAVAAGRRWAWILPPARRQLYRDGCVPAAPAALPPA